MAGVLWVHAFAADQMDFQVGGCHAAQLANEPLELPGAVSAAQRAGAAGLPHTRGHQPGASAGGGGRRADGELAGQAQVHPGRFRRDQALAQVTNRRRAIGACP